jgi:hypothetical protein
MMARTNLSRLLGNVEDPPAAAPAAPGTHPDHSSHDDATSAPGPADHTDDGHPGAEAEPQYLRFLRKETRLRADQHNALTVQARRLSRAKRGGLRITENTLIRISVDLLLASSERLEGGTEAELRRSVGLK